MAQALQRFRRLATDHFPDLVVGLLIASVAGGFSLFVGSVFWCYQVQLDISDIRKAVETVPNLVGEIKDGLKQHAEHLTRLEERDVDYGSRLGVVEGRLSAK